MIINFKNSYLFIHIPKCAGESITELLTSDLNRGVKFLGKHDYLQKALHVMEEKINSFTTFSVVRNPFHQVVSFYEHLRKPLYIPVAQLRNQYPGYQGFLAPRATCKLAMKLDFKRWVKEVYVKRKEYHKWHGNQLNWLVDDDNILRVDKILRFEYLHEDFLKLQKELGIKGDLPLKNKSRQVNYADYYNAETRDIVYEEFSKTIELFGYSLESHSGDPEKLSREFKLVSKIDSPATQQQQNLENYPQSLNYYELGMLLIYKRDWKAALSWYEKALSLEKKTDTDSQVTNYLLLGESLVKNGKLKEVIDCYHRVFQKDIQNLEFYYQFSIHLSQAGLISQAVTFFKDLPKPQFPQHHNLSKNRNKTNSIYESIWNSLHENNSEDFNLQIELDALELESGKIQNYFSEKKYLKILQIDKLSLKELGFLENIGISLEYVKLMKLENHHLENIYINCFESSNNRLQTRTSNVRKHHLKKKTGGYKYQAVEFTQSLVEFGYMYAVCPLSGRVVRSNTSFYMGNLNLIYRFQGEEVFYIIVNDFIGLKSALYISKLNVYIAFGKVVEKLENTIYKFQSYVVSNWKYVKNYLGNFNRSLVELYGIIKNLGHFFWQDITGIYYLYEQNLLEKIDYFCGGDNQYLDLLSIFPEIPENKVLNISEMSAEEKFRYMLKNNCFCLRITDNFIKQNVGNRIIKAGYNLCAQYFLEEVKQAKENCNLLLWINVRSHNKIWLEQDKNYAKIVDNLKNEFSHLSMGVVFDGTPDASDLVKSIIEQTKSKVNFYNTTLDIKLYESIVFAHYIDAYIAVVGSGLVITSWLTDKPGVAHGDRAHLGQKCFWSEVKEFGIEPTFLNNQEVKQSHKKVYGNYQVNWQTIYRKIFKIIKKIEKEKLTGPNTNQK